MDLCFLDVETTGLDPYRYEVIECCALVTTPDLVPVKMFHEKVEMLAIRGMPNPKALEINGWNPEVWDREAISKTSFCYAIREFIEGKVIIGHNVHFDVNFIREEFNRNTTLPFMVGHRYVDTCTLAWPLKIRGLIPKRSLEEICKYFKTKVQPNHSAQTDVIATYEVYQELMK